MSTVRDQEDGDAGAEGVGWVRGRRVGAVVGWAPTSAEGDDMQLRDQEDGYAVAQRKWVGSGVIGWAPTSAEGNDMQQAWDWVRMDG